MANSSAAKHSGYFCGVGFSTSRLGKMFIPRQSVGWNYESVIHAIPDQFLPSFQQAIAQDKFKFSDDMADSSDKLPRIFIWCWPRSISTCLEKCLSFVDGVQVWHEPYLVAFNGEIMSNPALIAATDGPLAVMFQKYVEQVEALKDQPSEFSGGQLMPAEKFTYPSIKSMLEEEEPGKKYVIIKDIAMAIIKHLDALPDVPSRHTFIIRHPHRFLTSQRNQFIKMSNYQGDLAEFDMFKASPLLSDGIYTEDSMHYLWKHVLETGKEPDPVIIDAEELMNYPEKILPKYLNALGIPFDERYLKWDESEESIKMWKGSEEQIIIGRMTGFFEKAFKSSCFLPNTHSPLPPKKEELSKDIAKVADYLMPGYEEMYEKRIKPE